MTSLGALLLSGLPLAALAGIHPVAGVPATEPPAAQFGEQIAVRLRTVVVRVIDGEGRPITGLAPADFRLRVGGKEVPVTRLPALPSRVFPPPAPPPPHPPTLPPPRPAPPPPSRPPPRPSRASRWWCSSRPTTTSRDGCAATCARFPSPASCSPLSPPRTGWRWCRSIPTSSCGRTSRASARRRTRRSGAPSTSAAG